MEMNEEQTKEIQIIVEKFFLETQRLVNRLVNKIHENEN
jgi:hypothetical protein